MFIMQIKWWLFGILSNCSFGITRINCSAITLHHILSIKFSCKGNMVWFMCENGIKIQLCEITRRWTIVWIEVGWIDIWLSAVASATVHQNKCETQAESVSAATPNQQQHLHSSDFEATWQKSNWISNSSTKINSPQQPRYRMLVLEIPRNTNATITLLHQNKIAPQRNGKKTSEKAKSSRYKKAKCLLLSNWKG